MAEKAGYYPRALKKLIHGAFSTPKLWGAVDPIISDRTVRVGETFGRTTYINGTLGVDSDVGTG